MKRPFGLRRKPHFVLLALAIFVFIRIWAGNAENNSSNIHKCFLSVSNPERKLHPSERLEQVLRDDASYALDFIRDLIEKGADVNAANEYGSTPLMLAAQSYPKQYHMQYFDVMQLLIENGANVNAADINGMTPLMWEAQSHHGQYLFLRGQGYFDVMQLLIDNGADVNATDINGMTPLMWAAQSRPAYYWHEQNFLKQYFGVMQLLIDNGANVNAADKDGRTPLMIAAEFAHEFFSVMRLLTDNGANINAVDKNGMTPLMLAAQKGEDYPHFILRTLLENGADVTVRDKAGKRALDYAEKNEVLKQTYGYGIHGNQVADDVDLRYYHPWELKRTWETAGWTGWSRLPHLDSPASLRISGDYPRIDGATSAYPVSAALVNETYAADDKAELRQYLACSQTEEAYNRLIRGEADVIFVLQPSDEQLQSAKDAGVELHFTPVAKDAFVFFVNRQNPVSGLSIEQIRNIYLKKITNWREVGGNDREILPYQRQANSGSQTAMIKEVMKGEALPTPLQERRLSMAGLYWDVATYQDKEEAIGYSFRFFTEEMMRNQDSLRIALTPESERQSALDALNPITLLAVDGIPPSVENIRSGTYPFTVDLFAVTAGTPNPHVRELIDWLLSSQGQELIEKTGYVAMPGL